MLFPSSACMRLFAAPTAWMFALVAAIALASPAGSSASTGAAGAPSIPVVLTESGAVRGASVQNMYAYLGIPYAAPPVGALRWQPPQPHARWSGTLAATAFANHCPQNASPVGFASVTEDCLYLNVFVPAWRRPGDKLPVMVWLHGGDFVDGESDDYDPDRLVARGVIVVTLNYRLGYLGFLATSGLDEENHTHVNYGLLDQQFALEWARTNIAAFGGDPARVTVFGQSAGGESVLAQLLAPGSAHLFSRAIVESGAYNILALPSLSSAELNGNALAGLASCSPVDTVCLRSLPVSQILAVQQLVSASAPLIGGPSPAVDGALIPLAPPIALARGAYNHVPVLQGSNHDEFRFFTASLFDLGAGGPLTATEYPAAVKAALTAVGLGSATASVLAKYPLRSYASPDLAYSALATDAVFSTATYETDVLLSAGTPVYAYEFSDENAPEDFLPKVSFPYGAAHGSELQFLYDSFDRPAPRLSLSEQRLAGAMDDYWTQFAKGAFPNALGLPLWFRFVGAVDDMQSLETPTPGRFFSFVPEHNVFFWAALAAQAALAKGTPETNRYLTIDALRGAARTIRSSGRRLEK